MFAAKNELLTRPSGYQISRSLRFRSSASAYLSRTPASTSGNQIFTVSFWIKRGKFGVNQTLFYAYQDGSNADAIGFYPDNFQIQLYNAAVSSTLATTQVFRDPSAWYHFVLAVDTTQATSTNRIKMYVNGAQITAFSTATYPAQNTNIAFNKNIIHTLCAGNYGSLSDYTDAYLAEVYWITGQALTPSSFGAFDTNGVWQPARYTGSYGTNGFYLNFSDNSGATSTTIGKDSSGNSNNWTPNNISVTSGPTYDSMIDSPTNYADGGNGRGNYCVMNPLDKGANISATNGNLYLTSTSNTQQVIRGSIALPAGQKTYFEIIPGGLAQGAWGIVGADCPTSNTGIPTGNVVMLQENNFWNINGSAVSNTTTVAANDILGIAFDGINNQVSIYKNNTLVGTKTASGSVIWYPASCVYNQTGTVVNFGAGSGFTYTPPSGFSALNTQNLPTPTIAAGNKYFDATTYPGTGSAQSITNSGSFQPDLVWLKCRSNSFSHDLEDVVRGAGNYLASDSTAAATAFGNVTSFNANGFSIGTGSTANAASNTYVGWQWKAGGSVSSNNNTNGSITSTVSANTSAGFSVVTYTGTGANATVGHGLGVAPSMIFVKARGTPAGTGRVFFAYHISIGNTQYLELGTTSSAGTSSAFWNNTSPTTSVFSLGTNAGVNNNTSDYVAYCFAPVAGYSAFGSYTGNGSADGPFVYLGFLPRYVMIKRSDGGAEQWNVIDTSRNPYNTTTYDVAPNSSGAETTSSALIDVTANGFKLRFAGTPLNTTSGTYIYAAFAENPFKYSRAR